MERVRPITALRAVSDTIKVAAMGFAIGTAGLIPGVSGGTMALLFGIYEELVEAIRTASDPQTLKALVQRRWRAFFAKLPWQLLAPLAVGALAAVILMSHFMEWLLLTFPVQVEAFFFGLVAASMIVVARKVHHWGAGVVIGFVLGTAAAWVLLDLTPAQTPNTLWMLFLSGAVAKCAMVLPGISGAFVLVLFGQYGYALAAVTQRNLLAVGLILLGAVVGLVTFSQALSWLFRRHHDLTLAVLGGLILASLRRLWPWRESVTGVVDELIVQANVFPSALTPEVIVAISLALVGFLLVLMMGSGRRADDLAHS